MPLYEYFCSQCQVKFELLRPMSHAEQDATCPTCHNTARRAISTFAAYSKSVVGASTPLGGSSGACGSCAATSCATCR